MHGGLVGSSYTTSRRLSTNTNMVLNLSDDTVLTGWNGGRYTINKAPLSQPCVTLDEAVNYLSIGGPANGRHPDIRVRPAGAPIPVRNHRSGPAFMRSLSATPSIIPYKVLSV